MKHALIILAALGLAPCAAIAAAPPNIANSTATCDPNAPSHCLVPTAGGAITTSSTYYSNLGTNSSPITITSSATQAVAARASRSMLIVANEAAVAMRCSSVNTVTFAGGGSTTGGFFVPATIGAFYTLPNYSGALYCITSSTSTTASVTEVY